MDDQTSILLEMDLGSNGGPVRFTSPEEIEGWLKIESEFWFWLHKAPGLEGLTGNIWSQQSAVWTSVNQLVERFKSASDEDAKSAILSDIKRVIAESYVKGKVLHSRSPKAQFLLKYAGDPENRNDIILGAYVLGYFIKAPFKPNLNRTETILPILTGLQEAILFEKGLEGISDAERRLLDTLRLEYQQLNQSLQSHLSDTKQIYQLATKEIADNQKAKDTHFGELFKKAEDRLEDITRTYDQKLALQSSVAYWTQKATKHRNLSFAFAILFAATSFSSAWLFYGYVYPILKDTPQDQLPSHWALAVVVVFAIMTIWIVRIVVRVLLGHIHLQRDSSERATMLLTYLALLREGKSLDTDEKRLILQALFRPSQSGLLSDDAAPSSFYDFITRSRG